MKKCWTRSKKYACDGRWYDGLRHLLGVKKTYIEGCTHHLMKYKCMRDEILYSLNPDLGYLHTLLERLVCPAEES
jgi:hypothetical protein